MLMLLVLSGCSYSFSGTSIAPDVKTVTIEKIDNTAAIVVPTLGQDFTEALRDKFISQSPLELASRKGDLLLAGRITNYQVEPLTIQGNDRAAQNRLTMQVQVEFTNTKYPDESWKQNFSNFVDFPSSQSLSSVEGALLEELQEKLAQDIFNKALSNW